jgi:membrane associated rhomboid family serine protease
MTETEEEKQNPEKGKDVRPGKLSDVVKFLVLANVFLFAGQFISLAYFDYNFFEHLALYNFRSDNFAFHQLITHMFLHGGFFHLFLNMFILWMFGSALEYVWHSKKFLIYYFFTGIGAALLHLVVSTFMLNQLQAEVETYYDNPTYEKYAEFMNDEVGEVPEFLPEKAIFLNEMVALKAEWAEEQQNLEYRGRSKELVLKYFNLKIDIPTVGASGAVFGILLAFGMLFPNVLVYIYFLFPIKAKYFVILLGFLELYFGVFRDDNIANFAHLGGMIFGFILLKIWGEKAVKMKNRN